MRFWGERRYVAKGSSCVAGELLVAESRQQKDAAKEDEPIANIS